MGYEFNGITKIIQLTAGTSAVDVQDLYSRWADWLLISENIKYPQAMRSVGGDPLPGSKALGLTYFLMNDWKIRPQESNHVLDVNGNLYSEDGSSPFVQTIGIYNVTIISAISSLVDSTIQQLPEIEAVSFNGGVTIDVINGTDGTEYPIGTPGHPCKTISNALSISATRGFKILYVIGEMTITSADLPFYTGGRIIGYSHKSSKVTISGTTFKNTIFEECTVKGTFGLGSEVSFKDCILDSTQGLVYNADFCTLHGTLKFNAEDTTSTFSDCITSDIDGQSTYLDFIDSPAHVAFNRFSGKIELINMTNINSGVSTINCVVGNVTIADSCTTGGIKTRGTVELKDYSNGTVVDDDSAVTLTWNKMENGVTMKGLLAQADSNSMLARKHLSNKAVISADEQTVHIYDDDGTTLLHTFDVSEDKKTRAPV